MSFSETETAFEASLTFNGKTGGGESYALSGYNVKDVFALEHYLGFLFVVSDSGVLIFDTHALHEPLKSLRSPGGRAVHGVTPKSSADDELLLITTSQSIYQISLLNLQAGEAEISTVSNPSRIIYHPAFFCGEELFFLEYDEAGQTSSLIKSPDHAVAAFAGHTRVPLTVADDRIFLCTETEMLLYDARNDSLERKKTPEYLKSHANPAYSEESETIYLVGENSLWRLDLRDSELSPAPLNTNAMGDPRIAASRDQLFVARSNGLVILNPFGDVIWDSLANFISAASDLRAPEIYHKYFIFTSIGAMGGSDVRVHSREYPNRFELISYEKRLTCPPVLRLGRLIAATGDEGSIELKVN